MKKIFVVILSLFLFSKIIYAKPIEYIYSDWIDYYPEGILELRIESKDMYKWYKMEDEKRIETEEYYDYLEGYEKIEESKKTFYRVINSEYIVVTPYDTVAKDTKECRKTFCTKIKIEPFNTNKEEEKPIKEEEVIINPDTSDALNLYYFSFISCFILLCLINCVKIYLLMSNRWNLKKF